MNHTTDVMPGEGLVRRSTGADVPTICAWMAHPSNCFQHYDEHSSSANLLDQFAVAGTSDPHGLFTLQKYILVYEQGRQIHACLGVSHKRGGATKLTPCSLAMGMRRARSR